jgi:aryl-alcohol dehydrogenase-like predicted oxidoreductase
MEYRQLGRSGLRVPVLSFGTGTFGGTNEFFQRWGQVDVAEATRMVDLCLDAGVNFFDTANLYSQGASEEILGQAVKGRRDKVLISTKATFATGEGANDRGSSRYHLMRAVEASLKRLGTDHIDLYFMHGFDGRTPVDETLHALDDLVRSGKVGYIGASNFSGWQLMKALATSEKYGLARYVVYQGYYSLIGRDYEWELMPLGVDQGVAAGGPPDDDEHLFTVVDALDIVARETGKSVAQVALNWLLRRPTVANIVIGARNEEQLKQNLGAVGWSLSAEQVALLDKASHKTPAYPYWHQAGFGYLQPEPAPR